MPQNDVWSAGRVLQYILIAIAFSACSYMVTEINDLSRTLNMVDRRLLRLEERIAIRVANLEEQRQDYTTRLNKADKRTIINEGKLGNMHIKMGDHELRLRALE